MPKKNTSLRFRAIFSLTFIFAAMGLSSLLIVGLIITERLDTFERDLAAANVRRARNSLQQDMVRIDNLLKDWAWWDDTYKFMTTVSGDYVDSNITPDVFHNQDLSVIAFITPRGEIQHASYMDRDGGEIKPPDEALLTYMRKTSLSYPADDLFSGQPEIINIRGSLWIAASRTVLTSQQTGPIQGRMWMILEIDDAYIEKLSQRTELALQLHVSDTPELPKAMSALRSSQRLNEAIVVPDSSTIWSGLLIPDAAGGESIALIANAPREVAATANTIMKTTLAVVLTFGFVGFLSSIIFLEKRILSRLSLLSTRVRRDAPDAQLCRIGHDCDEIDHLSNLVDTAFSSIRENERFLQEILGALKVGVMLVRKADKTIISVNPYACALIGRPEKDILGKTCHNFLCAAEVDKCPVIDQGQNLDNSRRVLLANDGQKIDILKSATIIIRDEQEFVLETFLDIREIENTRRLLQESEVRYKAIFMNTGTPGILINEDTSIAVANTEFLNLVGITEKDMRQAPSWTRYFHPDDTQRMLNYHVLRRKDENSAPRSYEARLMDSSGEAHYVRLTVAVIPNSQQTIAFLLDISDIKNAERKLQELAYTDALTGLPNRLCAMERLHKTLQGLPPENSSLAVFLLDLDDFKVINDSWGHAVGDIVLMEAGRRLASILKSSELLARLGGDEFIIVSDVSHSKKDEYAQLAHKLIDALAAPFQFYNSETYLSVSVGIATFPGDGNTVGQLIRCADLAMYQAKSFGKNIYRFHSPELTSMAHQRMEIERELRLALDTGEIVPFFQPVVDLESGRIIGAEALARWRKSDGRLISPVDFIPVAEQTNLITDIDLSIMSQACRQVRKWDESGLDRLRISCNISARHFQRGNLPQEVQSILEESALSPGQMTLEVTETVYMENIDQVRGTLEAIDRMGISIALDDFGTGYSSLSHVHTLSFDILKIDKSFIKNLPDHSALTLVRAMLGIAASLDIIPLAEGIETNEQYQLLKSLGCKLGQGYLFSPPVPAQQFEELLMKQSLS